MKITLESTDDTSTSVGGTPTRKWIGHTESGIPIVCYIAVIGAPLDLPPEQQAELERELRALPSARRELVSFDIRMAMD